MGMDSTPISRATNPVQIQWIIVSLRSLVFTGTPPFLQFLQIIVQAVKFLVPDATERVQPKVHLLKRLLPQLVNSPISDRMHFDDPGITKYTKMFGSLRLAKPQPFGDFPH